MKAIREQIIKLGELEFFFQLAGEQRGNRGPTLVLENSMGGSTARFNALTRTLSDTHQVFCYDRAGNGRSTVSPRPRTCVNMARELRALLKMAVVKPPFILVAASYGGFIARTYAHLYSADVSGLVLVEPSHEDFFDQVKQHRTPEKWHELVSNMDQLSSLSGPGCLQEWQLLEENARYMQSLTLPAQIPTELIVSTRFSELEANFMKLTQGDIDRKAQLFARWVETSENIHSFSTALCGHDVLVEMPSLIVQAIQRVKKRIALFPQAPVRETTH